MASTDGMKQANSPTDEIDRLIPKTEHPKLVALRPKKQ